MTAPPHDGVSRRGRGTKKRIDSKRRRLKCLRPVWVLGVATKQATLLDRQYESPMFRTEASHRIGISGATLCGG